MSERIDWALEHKLFIFDWLVRERVKAMSVEDLAEYWIEAGELTDDPY